MLKDNSMILTGKKPVNGLLKPNGPGYPSPTTVNLTAAGCHICRTVKQ
jgi:hypothetical protein